MKKTILLLGLSAVLGLCGCEKKPQSNESSLYATPIDAQVELPKAQAGDAVAQFRLAMCYLKGNDCPRDYIQAKNWFTRSASQGLTSAQFEIGKLYETGTGTVRNIKQAQQWFEKAANSGDAHAQLATAKLLLSEHFNAKNLELAKQWMQKAADQGLPEAENLLKGLNLAQLKGFIKEKTHTQQSPESPSKKQP